MRAGEEICEGESRNWMLMELVKVPRAKLEPLFLDPGRVSCDVEQDVILTDTGQVSEAQTEI